MKMPHVLPGVLVAVLSAATLSRADIITEPTRTFNVNQTIGDPQDPPQVFTQTISDSAILSLTEVDIGLHLVGTPADNGFASDMFVSLNQNLNQTAILLNRVGMSDSDSTGFFYDGWDVTFTPNATGGDIHLVDTESGLGVLTGEYQPDGRLSPTDTARPALLDIFNGNAGNGDWRLAVGDLSSGGQMELVSWSLTLTGDTSPVPEPSTFALLGLGAVGAIGWGKYFRRKKNA